MPLAIVILVGAVLRLVPIWFGLPFDRARPDEETAIGHAVAIIAGDPNPHFFHWPSLTFYVFAASFQAVSGIHRLAGFDPTLSVNEQYLVARGLVALAGTMTIAVLFVVVRHLADEPTALVASLFLAVAPLHVRESHFAMTDVLMTLFVTLSVGLLLRADAASSASPAGRISTWWFAAAGLCGGLAASTKYTGGAMLVPLLATQAASLRRGVAVRWRLALWASVAMLVAFAVGFVAGTPFALLDARSFVSGVGFDIAHLSSGQAYLDLGLGWSAHLERSLPYGLGVPVFGASILGAVVLARSSRSAAAIIGALCATLYALLGPGRTVFFRYVLPMVPMACLSAAMAVRQAAKWLGHRVPVPMSALAGSLAVAIALPPLVNSVWMDLLLARIDTRVLAGRWLVSHASPEQAVYDAGGVYAGSSLLGLPAHHWDVETYDAAHSTFRTSGGQLPDWLVLPESPLVYGSVPPALRRLAAEKYQLALTIEATRAPTDRSVYDRQDAFFLPIAGFGPIVRPGPTIRIYRRSQP